nr:hypothetical protein [Tanacetum cinerariifolium]
LSLIPEPILVDEDEDPKEEEFKEKEEPQEEDMDIDDEEDENEPELTDIDSLFGRIASLSRRLCGRETEHALVKKKGKEKDEYYGKLILDLGNEVRSSMEEESVAMENLVRKLGNAEKRAECKKL